MSTASTYTIEHHRLFSNLTNALGTDLASLSVQANGGRSILFVYPPADDERYIAEARKLYAEEARFIDLRQLYVEFIDACGGYDEFKELYDNMGREVFFSQNFSEGTFYSMIVAAITDAGEAGKIPFLVHTGTIFGMGFSNINIMEEKVVMRSKKPLVVFYPATIDDKEQILFLNRQIASRYRCILIK